MPQENDPTTAQQISPFASMGIGAILEYLKMQDQEKQASFNRQKDLVQSGHLEHSQFWGGYVPRKPSAYSNPKSMF